MSAFSAASSAPPRGCRRSTASTACSTRRSPRAASWRSRSAWAPTACGRSSRSSSPTTSTRRPTSSSPRRRGCAIARPASSAAPITVRAPCGGGIFGGQTHSQSPEALFTHVCGLKTVIPSNPYDAKGLLISAIEDDDPVIFFEPKRLYNGPFDGHPERPATPWPQHHAERGARRATTRPARPGRDRARRRGGDGPRLRHDGACGAGRGRGGRRRRRGDRPAHACCRSTSTRSSRR